MPQITAAISSGDIPRKRGVPSVAPPFACVAGLDRDLAQPLRRRDDFAPVRDPDG